MKFASTKTFGRIQSKIQTLTVDQYSKRLSGLSIYFKYNAGSHSPPNERSTEKCAIYFIKEVRNASRSQSLFHVVCMRIHVFVTVTTVLLVVS